MKEDYTHYVISPETAIGKQFVLYRHDDVSGVSGTGVVAEGVEFANGQCALRWYPKDDDRVQIAKREGWKFHGSISIFQSVNEIIHIHGHKGSTEVLYLDELAGIASRTRVYDPPWGTDKLIRTIGKRLKSSAKNESAFGRAVGSLVGMVRKGEKNAYRRGWNDAVIQNRIGTDGRLHQPKDEG